MLKNNPILKVSGIVNILHVLQVVNRLLTSIMTLSLMSQSGTIEILQSPINDGCLEKYVIKLKLIIQTLI